jgi:hypothetical protein
MEKADKPDSASLAFGLIFLAWAISLGELGFSLVTLIGIGMSAGTGPHCPAWALFALAAGPLAVAAISFAVFFYGRATIVRFLLLVIPVLLSVAEFIWMMMLWNAG